MKSLDIAATQDLGNLADYNFSSAERPLPAARGPTRVAIVGQAHVSSWARIVELTDGFACVGTFSTIDEALEGLPRLRPDIILLDLDLIRTSTGPCTTRFKDLVPKANILLLSLCAVPEHILEEFQAGAVGYLPADTTPDGLLSALAETRSGGAPMPGHIARRLVESLHENATPPIELASLSARELEVLKLLTDGLLNKEIASRLQISFDTVRTHIKHIYEKLLVRSRAEAVAKYLR
jgi:DNA-binding NarL/FixJ family response regulator